MAVIAKDAEAGDFRFRELIVEPSSVYILIQTNLLTTLLSSNTQTIANYHIDTANYLHMLSRLPSHRSAGRAQY